MLPYIRVKKLIITRAGELLELAAQRSNCECGCKRGDQNVQARAAAQHHHPPQEGDRNCGSVSQSRNFSLVFFLWVNLSSPIAFCLLDRLQRIELSFLLGLKRLTKELSTPSASACHWLIRRVLSELSWRNDEVLGVFWSILDFEQKQFSEKLVELHI